MRRDVLAAVDVMLCILAEAHGFALELHALPVDGFEVVSA